MKRKKEARKKIKVNLLTFTVYIFFTVQEAAHGQKDITLLILPRSFPFLSYCFPIFLFSLLFDLLLTFSYPFLFSSILYFPFYFYFLSFLPAFPSLFLPPVLYAIRLSHTSAPPQHRLSSPRLRTALHTLL